MSTVKAFSVRIPKELWLFLKNRSAEKEKPMNDIIQLCLEKYKKTCEKHLTNQNTMVE